MQDKKVHLSRTGKW